MNPKCDKETEENNLTGEISEKAYESNSLDKIDVESLIKDFKITNLDNFNVYLQQLSQVQLNISLFFRIYVLKATILV